jgi:predicted short-subunit dehydrogenase-like oxidoreductase (DUF2520 family)
VIASVRVIGSGRAGRAIAARLRERGLEVAVTGRAAAADPGSPADLVLLCVPDAAIAEVARGVAPGPWVAHVSGATTLGALEPHARRFSVHPLQTLTTERGPEQLDGAWGAVTGETDEARETATWLAQMLGLRPFLLADADRPLYHAAAVIAGNYLVTLYRTASVLFDAVGAPPEALVPLMERTIENGFVLTGPIARGDQATIDAHLRALGDRAPELVPLYLALAEATRR